MYMYVYVMNITVTYICNINYICDIRYISHVHDIYLTIYKYNLFRYYMVTLI